MTEVAHGEAALAQRQDRLSRTTSSRYFIWVESPGRTTAYAEWNGHRNASVLMRISFLGFRAEDGQYEVKTELPGGKSFKATRMSLEEAQAAADAHFQQWVHMMDLAFKID